MLIQFRFSEQFAIFEASLYLSVRGDVFPVLARAAVAEIGRYPDPGGIFCRFPDDFEREVDAHWEESDRHLGSTVYMPR